MLAPRVGSLAGSEAGSPLGGGVARRERRGKGVFVECLLCASPHASRTIM